jgi:gas vesicle protein
MIRLLFGLGLGYLIGTLFAPGKGSETREVIRKKFDDVKEELAERGQGARVEFSEGLSRASDKLAQAQEIAVDTVGKLDKNIHDIAKKGKDIVT